MELIDRSSAVSFFKAEKIEHFSPKEFACRCCGEIRLNPKLVVNIEKFRVAIKEPVRITSGYRCPKHNASLRNSARNSQHVQGNAVDFDITPFGSIDLFRIARIALESSLFNGVGIDDSYLHLDVREGPGKLWIYH